MDQIINEKVRRELERQKIAEKDDRDQFRRDVDLSNHNLMMAREHNDNIEKRKEKLIDDIQINALEESWRQRCEFKKKRDLVNHIARKGQVEQIQRRETEMIKEKRQQKQENLLFNEHESSERQKLRENSWQHRLKCYHHGRELLEQTKAEELRDAAEKQKLNETLMLVAQERARCETSGLEFVKSCQDVLPLHPNLLIIQKGKKN